jgi:exonuclease III
MRVTRLPSPAALGFYLGLSLLTAVACTSIKPTTFNAPLDTGPRTATVAFYNLENLFDTQDDPNTNDQDFLPGSAYKWDDARYRAKLANMASVLEQLGSPNGPDVIGVAEIENRRVLEDLVNQPLLAPRKYKIIHFDSPDPRGIDVALLYKADRFTPTVTKNIVVTLPDTTMGTRDILLVTGQLNGEKISFVVNHWPSRRGGSTKSDARRLAAADRARATVNELEAADPQARVLLMGDFNDTPLDSSIVGHLKATYDIKNLKPTQLYNAFYDYQVRGIGTICYKQKCDVFDQMILSPGLCDSPTLHYQAGSANIYKPIRLQSQEEKYAGEPLRTYGGKKYLGGFSDHYPVYLTLTK